MLSKDDGNFLLNLAREAIIKTTRNEKVNKPESYPESLDNSMGVFCTITKNNELRGCIGVPYPTMPLIEALISAACSVCEDPRFPKLSGDEAKDIRVEISILTEPELINAKPEQYLDLIEKRHGLILQYGPYSGLFLPQVWKEIPEKEGFLDHLCLKAGLSPGMWKENGTKLYKFEVQIFSE